MGGARLVSARRGGWWVAAAVLLLAFLLRLWAIQSRPLWYDEAFAVLFAEKGFRAMLHGTLTSLGGAAADVHPILYYSALDAWMRLAGESPLAVRSVSALVGALTLALLYDGCRRLFGARPALAALGLAALSPFHVYYSQEARMYAPLALGCVLASWCVVRLAAGRSPPGRYVLGLAAASALAMYMQSLGAFFLVVLGAATLARPRLARRVALGGLGGLALYLPWLLQLPGQLAKVRQAYWLTRPTLITVLQTAMIFHGGEELLEAAQAWIAPALAVGILGPVLLLFAIWRGRGAGRGVGGAEFAALLAFGPPALLFAASLYQPLYLQRALLPSALMYYAALGWAATRALPRPVAVLLLAGVATVNLAGLAAHYRFDQFPRPDYRAVTAFLAGHVQPGDRIVHSNKLTLFPMVYYNRSLAQSFVADPAGSGSDTLAYPTQQAVGLYASADVATAAGDARRIWFVIFDRAITEYQTLGKPTHPQLAWLQAHYRLQAVTHFGDLSVYEFAK